MKKRKDFPEKILSAISFKKITLVTVSSMNLSTHLLPRCLCIFLTCEELDFLILLYFCLRVYIGVRTGDHSTLNRAFHSTSDGSQFVSSI